MIFGDLVGLKFPDICLTGEEKPRKKSHQETCPDRGSNPGTLRDRRACYCLFHSRGHYLLCFNKSLKLFKLYFYKLYCTYLGTIEFSNYQTNCQNAVIVIPHILQGEQIETPPCFKETSWRRVHPCSGVLMVPLTSDEIPLPSDFSIVFTVSK